MKCLILLVSLQTLLFVAFGQEKSECFQSSYQEINIYSDSIRPTFDVDDIVGDSRTIHLEYNGSNYIRTVDKVIVALNRIFVLDRRKSTAVFCFNMEGDYLFRVGGKELAVPVLDDIIYDKQNQELGVLANNKVFWYSAVNGIFTNYVTKFRKLKIKKIAHVDSSLFLGYSHNRKKSKKWSFNYYLLNKRGEVMSKFLKIQKEEEKRFLPFDTPITKIEDQIHFGHLFNDTIFTLNGTEFISKYVFDFNDLALRDRTKLPAARSDMYRWLDYTSENNVVAGVDLMYETSNTFLFKFSIGTVSYIGFYDKNNQNVLVVNELMQGKTLFGDIIAGSWKNYFINVVMSPQLQSLKRAFEKYDMNVSKLRNYYGEDLYNHIKRIPDKVNPTLIFTEIRLD